MSSLVEALMSDLGASSLRLDEIVGGDIQPLLEALRPVDMAFEITPEVVDTIELAGNAALLEVGASAAFNMVSPRVVDYLSNFAGEKISSITKTTRKQLARTLAEGVNKGEGPRQLGRRVKDVLSLPGVKGHALTIARTETHNAANFGRLEGYKQSTVVTGKKWHTTIDGRQRDTHGKLNGKKKPLNGVFRIRGASAQAPGQFGVAKEDINCRCVILPVVPRADSTIITATFVLDAPKSVDEFFAMQRRQQPKMFDAAVRGFKQWERNLIREIGITNRS